MYCGAATRVAVPMTVTGSALGGLNIAASVNDVVGPAVTYVVGTDASVNDIVGPALNEAVGPALNVVGAAVT